MWVQVGLGEGTPSRAGPRAGLAGAPPGRTGQPPHPAVTPADCSPGRPASWPAAPLLLRVLDTPVPAPDHAHDHNREHDHRVGDHHDHRDGHRVHGRPDPGGNRREDNRCDHAEGPGRERRPHLPAAEPAGAEAALAGERTPACGRTGTGDSTVTAGRCPAPD